MWEAKDQETYDLWLASTAVEVVAESQEDGPLKDFDRRGQMGREGGMIDVDANSGRAAWEARPAIEKIGQPVRSFLHLSFPISCLLPHSKIANEHQLTDLDVANG